MNYTSWSINTWLLLPQQRLLRPVVILGPLLFPIGALLLASAFGTAPLDHPSATLLPITTKSLPSCLFLPSSQQSKILFQTRIYLFWSYLWLFNNYWKCVTVMNYYCSKSMISVISYAILTTLKLFSILLFCLSIFCRNLKKPSI